MSWKAWVVSEEANQAIWLALDPYGIYRQRRMLGAQVWRGQEWWMA